MNRLVTSSTSFLASKSRSLLRSHSHQNNPAMSTAIRAEIDRHIAENKVVVFSKTWCPYCTRAKEEIGKLKVPYKAIELDVSISLLIF